MKYLIAFILICLAALWLSRYIPGSAPVESNVVPEAEITLPAVRIDESVPQVSGYVELTGTALMDTGSGLPGSPYIKYSLEDGTVATKQLVFADSRGCHPSAGDIPCVATYREQAYPNLATGQAIFVKGYVRADRLLVTGIELR